MTTVIIGKFCLFCSVWMRTVRLRKESFLRWVSVVISQGNDTRGNFLSHSQWGKCPSNIAQKKLSHVSPPSCSSHCRQTRCFWCSCTLMCAVGRLERLILQWPSVAVQNAEGLPHPGHHREPGAGLHQLRRAQEMMSFTTAPGHLHQTRLTPVSHT